MQRAGVWWAGRPAGVGAVLLVAAVPTAVAALLPHGATLVLLGGVQAVGLVVAVAGVLHHRPARPAVWVSLVAAAVLYSGAWWCLVAGAGAVAVVVACSAAFLALGRVVVLVGRQSERDAAVDAADVALLAVAAASASLTLVLVLRTGEREPDPASGAWLAVQAAGAVVFVAAATWAVVTRRARSGSGRLLLVTAAGMVAWHLLTIAAAVGPGYRPGSAVDAALVPAWVALVAATWHPSMRALGRPVAPTGRHFPGTLAAVGAAVTLVVLPALARWSGAGEPPPALVAATGATVLLLVGRQLLATRSARRGTGVDPLTGLGTRRSLLQALTARLTDPASPPALLCVADLEAFADVNATRGHAAGDRALAEVAGRLAAAAPPGARTFRISGGGFAVLAQGSGGLPGGPAGEAGDAGEGGRGGDPTGDADATSASRVSQRLLEALEEPVAVPGGEVRLRGRVGEVALPGWPTTDPDDAAAAAVAATAQLGDAELALGEAVRRHLPVVRATPPMLAVRRDERALAARLPSALVGGEVVPHYQPIARLGPSPEQDRLSGFEALARWEHPERGTLGADQLLALAERLGVVRDVDEAVLRVALADCARWRASGAADRTVSVNASASTLMRQDLPAAVLAALARADLPGTALVLEITEGSWLADRRRIAERLLLLREAGVRVAVDDFGTGYASLDYLVSFPVDSLKVDRSLVQRIAEPACARLLRGVVDITRDLGVLALAEGVGTAEQVERARELGFGAVQGVALGPAVPVDQLPPASTAASTAAGRSLAGPAS